MAAIANTALFHYLLSLADSNLVLGHRLSEWAGHGPMLEEDIALSNLALDLLGQARSLFSLAGVVEGVGRDEDQLAYFRDATAYRNVLITELPIGDFAFTMVRHLFYSVHCLGLWRGLSKSANADLAAIAAKAEKELLYHQRHSAEWVIRLGDGTEESHARTQTAVDELWSYTDELFDVLPEEQLLIEQKLVPDPATWKTLWLETIRQILQEATMEIPEGTDGHVGRSPGRSLGRSKGRTGQHTEHLGYLLAEMQHMQRTYPGAVW